MIPNTKSTLRTLTLLFTASFFIAKFSMLPAHAQPAVNCTTLNEIIILVTQNSPAIKGEFMEDYNGDKIYIAAKKLTPNTATYYEGQKSTTLSGASAQHNRFEQILWKAPTLEKAIAAAKQYVKQLENCGCIYQENTEAEETDNIYNLTIYHNDLEHYIYITINEEQGLYPVWIELNIDIIEF